MSFPGQLIDAQGKPVELGPEIGRGGEGAVFEVIGRSDLVAKVYMTPPDKNHSAKLSAMVAAEDDRLSTLAAWPTGILNQKGGAAAGFLMPKVSGFRPAFELYGPKLRLKQFPKADWRFLIRAASNTARAFRVVHGAGHVIGDVNHGNLVVGQDATVRLIDCDSFQITVGTKIWFCEVGVPEYQPPEMQGLASYAGFTRTSNHDYFGLAVTIFRLLCLNRLPYSGRYMGKGDPPMMEEAIKGFRYAYGGDSRTTQMTAPPGSLSMDALTPEIRQMFEAAFLRGGAQSGGRPTPAQWINALDGMAGKLRQCSSSTSHHYLATLPTCPWCEIEARSNSLLFPAVFIAGNTGTDGFMLLWQQVSAVPLPGPREPMPNPPKVAPTDRAKRVGRALKGALIGMTAALAVGEAGLWQFAVQEVRVGAMAGLAVLLLAAFSLIKTATGKSFRRALSSRRQEWKALQTDWMSPPWPLDPTGVRAGLDKIKLSYDSLQADRAEKLKKLYDNRRASQMVEYLDRFQIAGAKVKGIGQTKAAILQSFGIETAGDVVFSKVILISGFGPATAQNLVAWRTGLERSFRFDANRAVSPADIGMIENAVGVKRRLLEQRLSAGLSELRDAISQEKAARETLRSQFNQVAAPYAQAEADSRAISLMG